MSTPETPLLARTHLELIAAQLRAARAAGMAAVEAANAGLLALTPILGGQGAAPAAGPAGAPAPSGPRRPLRKEEIRCFGGQTIGAPDANVGPPASPVSAADARAETRTEAPTVTPPAANSSD